MFRFSEVFGYSSMSAKPDNFNGGHVEIYHWKNCPGASAHIIGMKVVTGKEKESVEYLHFGPKSMKGVADRSWDKLTQGTEGDFIGSFEDACLVEGFRRRPDLYEKDTFYQLGDNEKLNRAYAFPTDLKAALREGGAPTETIKLTTLNTFPIYLMVQTLKKQKPLFAPMSSPSGNSNSYNCASIIWRALQAGQANLLAPPLNSELGRLDLDYVVPPTLLFGTLAVGVYPALVASILSVFIARFTGGALEGHQAVGNLITLMKKENHYNLPAGLTLEVMYTVASGLIGLVAPDSAPMMLNVLPEDVMQYARELQAAVSTRLCADGQILQRATEKVKLN